MHLVEVVFKSERKSTKDESKKTRWGERSGGSKNEIQSRGDIKTKKKKWNKFRENLNNVVVKKEIKRKVVSEKTNGLERVIRKPKRGNDDDDDNRREKKIS